MAKSDKKSLCRTLSGALAALMLCLGVTAAATGCAKKITYTIDVVR